jgi:outer membrane protein
MFSKYIAAGIIIAGVFGLATAQNGPTDSLTVETTVRMVIDNYPAIRQVNQNIAVSDAQIEQSRSGYYPDIVGSGSYNRIGPVPTFTFPDLGTFDMAPHDNYDFHVGLRQTLYDFGKRSAALNLAKTGKQTALENEEALKSNLAYQTVEVFYSILFLRRNAAVLDEQIDALNQHLGIIKNKVEAGTATDFDILTTQVRIANTQTQKIDIAAALKAQEISFRQLVGLAPDKPVLLKGDFSVKAAGLDINSLIATASEQLPEMRLARNAATSAQIQYRIASIADRPSLAANLILGAKNGYSPEIDKIKANWVAGLQISASIFNGFLTRGKANQASAYIKAADYHIQDLERSIKANVEQAVIRVAANQEKLNATEPLVAQAEQAVSLAKIRYDAGTATNLDLLDAETALSNARLLRLKASYDLVKSRYSLDKAIGNKIW